MYPPQRATGDQTVAVSPPRDHVETSVLEAADTGDALQRLVEEQAALRRVATLVAQDASPAEVFEAVVTEIGRQVPDANAAALSRYDTDDTLTMIGKWSRPDGYVPVGTSYPLVSGTVGSLVAERRQPGRVELDRETLRSLPEAIRDLGWLSAVGAPIIVDGRLWGLVGISSTTERSLPSDTEERLAEFTELVAAAIANADSRENLAHLVEEQAALRRVATLVAQGARPSEIFSAVSEEVSNLFDAGSAVFRFDDDGRGIIFVGIARVIAHASGAPRMSPVGTRWEFDKGMPAAQVHRTGRSVRMEDADLSARTGPAAAIAREIGLVSSVASPIVVEGRLWGTVSVGSRQRLPPDAESRLEKFTELVATAIANTESRQALAQLATEQAALRRVATLAAEGVPAADLFSGVTTEVAQAFADADPSLVASVIRFDAGPECVLVGASRTDEREPVGSRWKPKDLYVSTRVLHTGHSARVDEADLDSVGGPDADVLRLRGSLHQMGSPVVVDGRLWGTMTLDSEEALPPDIDRRLASFVELMATAIANAENRSELAASRKRLVAASDEARRRIERDLHDGTQQRLVSLALAVRAAEAEVPTRSPELRAKLSNIATGLGEAVEDLQELSRGIHPAVLTEAGLGPALETLALRSPITVDLKVKTRERFPEAVEVAAYFIASESLANAAKHSQATHIAITLAFDNERLRLALRDDGIGGADPARGSGLTGLRDRVDALGGTLDIETGLGAGTSLTATLPVADDPGDRSM